MQVTIICDRCKKTIKGLKTSEMTGGYYEILPGGYWSKFVNGGERKICDECMFHDERYIKVYGKRY